MKKRRHSMHSFGTHMNCLGASMPITAFCGFRSSLKLTQLISGTHSLTSGSEGATGASACFGFCRRLALPIQFKDSLRQAKEGLSQNGLSPNGYGWIDGTVIVISTLLYSSPRAGRGKRGGVGGVRRGGEACRTGESGQPQTLALATCGPNMKPSKRAPHQTS